jgi:hypothetical protein
MSTRCTIHFHWNKKEKPTAIIYRHGDGYPEEVLPDLEQFFTDVEEQTNDTQFGDPSYLAAKFVVWQADKNAMNYRPDASGNWGYIKGNMLDFISLGVLVDDPDDIEWRYHIWCGGDAIWCGGDAGHPEVTHEKVPFSWER